MDLWTKIVTLAFGSICFGELCLGATEAIYFKKYYGLDFDKDDCTVRGLVLGGAIIDILCGSVGFFGLLTRLCNKESYQNINEFILRFHILKLSYLVIVIALYHTNISCNQYILDNAPEFWTFIMIHFVSGCTIIGFIFILLLAPLIIKIYKKCTSGSQTVIDHNNGTPNNYYQSQV